jgi:sugar phosphate isomerase/epimerase
VPGNWGNEVPVGTGEVDWKAFFITLVQNRFDGYCCFEREMGNQRVADLTAGRKCLEKVLKKS